MTFFLIVLAINNVNQNSRISVNDGRSANGQSMNSPLQDGIDYPENAKTVKIVKTVIIDDDSDDGYDDDSDSCCTSDVTDNENNAFDGVDKSVTQTAKHYN